VNAIATPTLEIPFIGAGLGYRSALTDEAMARAHEIDFVEIITEQFLDDASAEAHLFDLCQLFKVIPHGVSLSVGSPSPLNFKYLSKVKRVSDMTESPYYSEHLCICSMPGIDIGHLSPFWLTEEVLKSTIEKVKTVQDYLQKPLVLENTTYLLEIPGATMSQTDFFNALVRETGCGVLLDVTNVYINSINHQFSALDFIHHMPADHIVQVHLAGGHWRDGLFIDSHSQTVQEGSWELLAELAKVADIKGAIIEHDQNFIDMSVMMKQIERLRNIIA
jgi:uncharacterized protein (UPF0276 family)